MSEFASLLAELAAANRELRAATARAWAARTRRNALLAEVERVIEEQG